MHLIDLTQGGKGGGVDSIDKSPDGDAASIRTVPFEDGKRDQDAEESKLQDCAASFAVGTLLVRTFNRQ